MMQSEQSKITALEDERDMIFGLLKQLRVTLFNMCNEEKSDLEWIYETNMVMKDIDFMFLHGYLQDSKTELAELQKQNDMMREALEMARNGIIWYMVETDLANGCDDEALQHIDAVLATVKGE